MDRSGEVNAQSLLELADLIARYAGTTTTRGPLPNVVLSASGLRAPPAAYMAEPAFAVVAQGSKRVVLGDQVFTCSAGQYLIYSVDLPLSSQVIKVSGAKPFLGLGLGLKPEVIASLLLESNAFRAPKTEPRGIAVSDLTADLVDAVVRLLRLLDRPDDIPILAPGIEREILRRLINGRQGAMVRQLGLADSRMAQIGRAILWIRAHYAESFRIEDLASTARMSVTSFHRHFLRVTSLSPLQFQKQIRMQEARSQLIAANNVAAVGFAVGYGSPSQFNREYRRMFGVAPGQDAARLRKRDALSDATN